MSSSSLESNTLLTLRFSTGAGRVDLSRFTPSGALSIRTKLQGAYEIGSYRTGLSAGEGGLLRVKLQASGTQLRHYARIVFTYKMMRLKRGPNSSRNALISIACFFEAACMARFGTR